jgi:hypothetical protein
MAVRVIAVAAGLSVGNDAKSDIKLDLTGDNRHEGTAVYDDSSHYELVHNFSRRNIRLKEIENSKLQGGRRGGGVNQATSRDGCKDPCCFCLKYSIVISSSKCHRF